MESRTRPNGQSQPQQRPQLPPLNPTNPICRCRVMYLGSSVPHFTKDGLQGIQEPLRELYPVDQTILDSSNVGIDSWLSIWSNGILIENVDETGREVKRFFKIEALHYCAAVKYVDPISHHQQQPNMYNNNNMMPNVNLANLPRFLPLDSPHSRQSNPNPPVFASIMRRTTGIKVLECHAFICKREAAANALVRCCFHAYADTMYAKQLCSDGNPSSIHDINNNIQKSAIDINLSNQQANKHHPESTLAQRKSKSIANLIQEDNYRTDEQREVSSLARRKSTNEQPSLDNYDCLDRANPATYAINGDLKKQSNKFSKSTHHLDQANYHAGMVYNQLSHHQDSKGFNQSTSTSCINLPNNRLLRAQQQQQMVQQQQVPPTMPFHTPYSARIPSYPPQGMLIEPNTTSQGGTLRSIKSMAANSIASTLLRSKKHAKATSMAQLNHDKVISFHQPMMMNAATLGRPIMMPAVPAMFLPNLPPATHHHMMNGSQTMKPVSSRPGMPILAPNMNFEGLTPKEMKKLLKKSAKYGLDPTKYDDNGLPSLPIKPPLLHLQPPPIPSACNIPQPNLSRSGTIVSQSAYSDLYSDLSQNPTRMPPQMMGLPNDPSYQMKPLLVKPNPEFLKSKAGKKWLKQQKEFKKLLPPHLEGLPIIFGPPPLNALEPAGLSPMNGLPMPPAAATPTNAPPFMTIPSHPGLPVLDSSGYYNPHPFQGQNGGCDRASAASTLLRYSPHSQLIPDVNNIGYVGSMYNNNDCWQKNHQVIMRNGVPSNTGNSIVRDCLDDSSTIERHNGYDSSSRNFLMNGNGMRPKQRNHMVEQSVISLGDEHDLDDVDDQDDEETGCNHSDKTRQHNDTYTVSSHHQEMVTSGQPRSRSMQQTEKHVTSCNNNGSTSDQLDNDLYSQPTSSDRSIQQNDDQGSYSSGIYRRGHMNERAFSYSIRQEHKSNGTTSNNSEAEYSTRNEIHSDTHSNRTDNHINYQHHLDHQESQIANQNKHFHQQQVVAGNIYQANKREKNVEYYRDNNDTRSIPVNELTSRLENQLNMRSFANSRIKSNI